MAIEYKLKGAIDLNASKELLLTTLGPALDAERGEAKIAFKIKSALISIVGADIDSDSGIAMLFFRVLDKERVVEATTLTISCVAALLPQVSGDLALFRDEHLIMERAGGTLRAVEPGKPRGKHFWTRDRLLLLGLSA